MVRVPLPVNLYISDHWFLRILSASVRDNILFSHAYDENFYNLVLDGMSFLQP